MVNDPLSLATDGDFVFFLCFSLLLPYYKNPFLDLGKNIVKWLGQCFLPELANYNTMIQSRSARRFEKKRRMAMELVIYYAWRTTVRNKDEELKTLWESIVWGITRGGCETYLQSL